MPFNIKCPTWAFMVFNPTQRSEIRVMSRTSNLSLQGDWARYPLV